MPEEKADDPVETAGDDTKEKKEANALCAGKPFFTFIASAVLCKYLSISFLALQIVTQGEQGFLCEECFSFTVNLSFVLNHSILINIIAL